VEERSYADIDDHRLLRAFLEEAEELLEGLNASLLALEKDTGNRELVHEIFRLTHSLKSEAALVGFGKLSSLAHRLEDVFEKVRDGELPLDRALMDAIFAASDLLHELTGRISRGEGETEVDSAALIAELERLAGLDREDAAGSGFRADRRQGAVDASVAHGDKSLNGLERYRIQEALDRGHRVCRVEFELDADVEMRYPRAYLVFNNLEAKTNLIKSIPDLTTPGDDDSRYSRFSLLFTTDESPDRVRSYWGIDQVREVIFDSWTADTIQESGFLLDAPIDGVYPGARLPEGIDRSRRTVAGARAPDAAHSRVESTSVRVDTKKLAEIWQLVADLVTWKTRLSSLSDRIEKRAEGENLEDEMEQVRDSLEKITGSLQQAIMETSMVPIAVLFNKFPRLVRDLSRKLGKDVELKIEGLETEIDRSLVEVLSDPLTHVIRNALDHGIESAAERRDAAKPAKGSVTISAQQLGGRILIEVADDGRGVDVEKIRQKATAPPEMSDEEVIQYIFSPGFSTKEDVTDLSGRGVGMDVVANRIRGVLKGDVQVKTEPGGGTRITIYLPLSLAILEVLVVRCRGYHNAVAVRDIEETVKVKLRGGRSGESVLYREKSIPTLRLDRLFYGNGRRTPAVQSGGFQPALSDVLLGEGDALVDASGLASEGDDKEYNGVVIRHKNAVVCLVVDQLVEEEDIVIKPVSDLLNMQGLFSGVSVLGDGRILFVLNTARLVELARSGG
jgi:two-component system chemotaxis sensor kinase CheA